MTSDASSTTEQELLCSDPSKAAALRELCRQTGYSIKQENGQRKYGGPPPGWNDLIPGKGCEIFVGKLPRDLYEDELVPVLEKCGRIYELRLMMDFNGNNRGFAFVKYTTQKEAKRALKQLNNHEIRKGRLLGVCKSVDNCRLFVGGIPKTKQKQEILVEMRKLAEGVTNVIVYPAAADKTKNRGFAFVEFQDHHTAAMARRKLQHTRPQVWGHPLAVDWAEPEVEVDEDVMAQVKILYVRNLMLQTTEEQLEKEFTAIVPQEAIERVKKIRDYGFVHFSQREHAIKCMKALNGKLLDGSPMEVTLAKPVDRETYVRYTRANNRSGAEGGENQAAQQVPAFVATTFDPTLQAGAYPLTFHPGTGPIYYGQLPYTLQTANPQQQRFALPAGSALPRQIQTQGLLQTTIGAAGVPLGIPGAATGVGSRPGAVGGAAGLRSGRGRIGVNSRGYLSGRGQQYRGYAHGSPSVATSGIDSSAGAANLQQQVSDELLSQLPPQQFAPQQQVSGGGLQHGGAGREIRLTARYGSHPYQPVISQATSEASSSSIGGVVPERGVQDAQLQPSLSQWPSDWSSTLLIPGGTAGQQPAVLANQGAGQQAAAAQQQQQLQFTAQPAAVHPYQIVYLT